MNDRAKPDTWSARTDGVRNFARPGRRAKRVYQALALLLVACSAGYVLMPSRSTPMPSPNAARPAASAIENVLAARVRDAEKTAKPTLSKITNTSGLSITPRRAEPTRAAPAPTNEEELKADGDTTPDLSNFIPPGEAPTAGEVIEELHKAGIYSGIGAFSPPGTSPPLVGLAVPDDFELPEGYVRHFQVTDDGQRIDPILMFSPDYEFFDEHGQPIEIPQDRVVPPELAPPGLPIREIEIPPERETGDLSR